MNRRTFLLASAGGIGALVVGWSMLRPAPRAAATPGSGKIGINGWIELTADGGACLAVPRCEMGQGVYTGLAMLAAEELDLPLERIRVLEAPLDQVFRNIMVAEAMLPELFADQRLTARAKRWLKQASGRQSLGVSVTTAGSTTMADLWRPVRMVSAHARATLVHAGARLHSVDPQNCRTEDGFLVLPDGRRIAYAELLAGMKEIAAASHFTLKPAAQFRLIGRPHTRIDTQAKCDGSAKFAMDVRLPGMRYAALAMPPSLGARMVSFRPAPNASVLRVPAGYGQGESLAVIADSWWVANEIAEALDITWDESSGAGIDNQALQENRKRALDGEAGNLRTALGDAAAAMRGAARTIDARYAVPYVAHAAIEPMNCTAQVVDGVVKVWAPVQASNVAITAAARAAKVSPAAVELVVPFIGGGFGRRLDADFVFQAVAIAVQTAPQPVQLVWSREQDFRHDFFRPAADARLRAALDANGKVAALEVKVAVDSVGRAQRARIEGNSAAPGRAEAHEPPAAGGLPYLIAHQAYRQVQVDDPVPIGSWRSVNASYDGFFVESFIDEMAAATNRDPVALRREMLQGRPRHLATLELAVARSGYSAERQTALRAQGRALGVALFESVGSVVAQVAEVSIENQRPRVHHVVCAIHCGQPVNPGTIHQQVEGAIVMGMGAALDDGIEIDKGRVRQDTFRAYPLPLMRNVPSIETYIVPSADAPSGVGEAALPPIAAAIGNAVFTLTGRRLRALPLRLS